MRALLLGTCVLMACSKESETKSEPPPAQPSEPAPSAAGSAGQPPHVTKPDKPAEPAAASTAAPKADCDAIITAEDIEKHCKVKVEIGASQHEGKMGVLGVCARVMSRPGEKFPIAHWKLSVHAKPADAEGSIKLEKTDGAKDLAGIGDVAWTNIKVHEGLGHTSTLVGVRKDARVLTVFHTKDSLNTKPPCTLDQLVEVARTAVSRLP